MHIYFTALPLPASPYACLFDLDPTRRMHRKASHGYIGTLPSSPSITAWNCHEKFFDLITVPFDLPESSGLIFLEISLLAMSSRGGSNKALGKTSQYLHHNPSIRSTRAADSAARERRQKCAKGQILESISRTKPRGFYLPNGDRRRHNVMSRKLLD